MKSSLACKPFAPIPDAKTLTLQRVIGRSENGETPIILPRCNTMARTETQVPLATTRLGRVIRVVASWFAPDNVQETLPVVDPGEIEALERHIRKFNEKHRFNGFPC